jgi:tRNA G18 (ribose-2'-O)-methylase SpoU
LPGGLGGSARPVVRERARLIGDGIEKPANARALMDAAAMFAVPAAFRDTHSLAKSWSTELGGGILPIVETTELLSELLPILAIENAPGSTSVYDSSLPKGSPSIVVGNERRGIRGDVMRAASACVDIPMPGRGLNTLNVASAAAVALFYLLALDRRPMRKVARPEQRRPGLLLLGPSDHVEAGSVLRSAAAFGWRAVGLDDSEVVWFGVPRAVRTEGRAAARSNRNAIRVLPMRAEGPLGFARVVIAGVEVDGPLLHRVDLAGGRNTLLVLPDEGHERRDAWRTVAPKVEFARVALPAEHFPYRYRLVASIVLAEAARQVGRAVAGEPIRRPRRGLTYESALAVDATAEADVVLPDELRAY